MTPMSEFALDSIRSKEVPLSPLARLRRLAALEQKDIGVVVIYAVAIGLVSLTVPIAAQAIVNTVAFTALTQPLVVLSALVFFSLLAAGILRALQYKVVETLQQRFFVRATYETTRRLTEADVRAFAQKTAPELVQRFFDVVIIQKAASTLLLDGLTVILQGGISLVLLAFYHPALLAFDIVLIALISFVIFGLGRGGITSAIHESKQKYATVAWLTEIAHAFRAFKSRESAAFAFDRSDALARAYVDARKAHFRVLFRQLCASHLLQAIAIALLLGLGGFLVIKGQLTLGQLVAAELIVTSILVGVAKSEKFLENYYDLVASMDKIGSITDIASEREGGPTPPSKSGAAHLLLESVAFAGDKYEALHDVSLEVTPESRIAVLVSNTSGKRRLIDILYGLRMPSAGTIKLDGVDIRMLSLADFRTDVALVSDNELFNASVLDNVRFGRDVGADVIAEALDIVGLSEDMGQLPQGVLTLLGQGKTKLHSSQAARLTVARALVARPRLLIVDTILDELDAEAVREILNRMSAAHHKTSVIVFTNRDDIAEEIGFVTILNQGVLRAKPTGK